MLGTFLGNKLEGTTYFFRGHNLCESLVSKVKYESGMGQVVPSFRKQLS